MAAIVTLRDSLIRVVGDLAYQVGTEAGEGTLAGQHVPIEQHVINVSHREAREWKRVYHHHSDPSPAMQDGRERWQPPQVRPL